MTDSLTIPTVLHEPLIKTKWLSALVGIILALMVLILWWIRHEEIAADHQKTLDAATNNFATHIEIDIDNRLTAFQMMANRWFALPISRQFHTRTTPCRYQLQVFGVKF